MTKITVDKALIEQAVAALESLDGLDTETECVTIHVGDEIDALRAALAEPVVEPVDIDQIAVERYKVVPAHDSMFHRWAVVAGNGSQQLFLGREVECQNMARKFAGAFLDGAYLASHQPAVELVGWQPIDTAPKDGTEILLRSKRGRVANGSWLVVNGDVGYWAWSLIQQDPTHWMPIPAFEVPCQHITNDSTCWCNPETVYTDPDTGASVIVHKDPQ